MSLRAIFRAAAQFTGINALFGVPIVLMSDSAAELFSRLTLLAAIAAGMWLVLVVLMGSYERGREAGRRS